MSEAPANSDPAELAKFEAVADEWWNPEGPLKTLHDINPLRVSYISERVTLKGACVLDVGLLGRGNNNRGRIGTHKRRTGLTVIPAENLGLYFRCRTENNFNSDPLP